MREALWLSARVSLLAMLVVVPCGAALGWFLARGRGAWRALADVATGVMLAMPPTVVGYALLVLLGRRGILGRALDGWFGVRLVFTTTGAAVAAAAVSLPLMAKGAEAAFARVDRSLEDAARANGMSPWAVRREVTFPLAARALGAAVALAWLRALGEFGATLVFAGYVPGETSTAPLEVWSAMQSGDDDRARALVLSLAAMSAVVTALTAWWSRRRSPA